MEIYKDVSGTSGITQYEIGNDYLDLEFRGGVVYRYDNDKPGPEHLQNMIALAQNGKDLATYVNQHVRKNFSKRIR